MGSTVLINNQEPELQGPRYVQHSTRTTYAAQLRLPNLAFLAPAPFFFSFLSFGFLLPFFSFPRPISSLFFLICDAHVSFRSFRLLRSCTLYSIEIFQLVKKVEIYFLINLSVVQESQPNKFSERIEFANVLASITLGITLHSTGFAQAARSRRPHHRIRRFTSSRRPVCTR